MDLGGHQSWLSFVVLGGAALAASLYVTFGPEEGSSGGGRRRGRRRRGRPPGLPNLGNTCFTNAILQALSSVPAFREWLEERGDDFPDEGVGRALARVLAYLDGEAGEEEVSAGDLLRALRHHGWHISREEHDALEMLQVCFTSLEEELELTSREGCKSPLESFLLLDDDENVPDTDKECPGTSSKPSSPPGSPRGTSPPPTPHRLARTASFASSTCSARQRRSSASGVFSRCASDLELSADNIWRQVAARASRRTATPFGGTLASKVTAVAATANGDGPSSSGGPEKKSPVSSTPFNTISLSLPRVSVSPFLRAMQEPSAAVTLETLLQIFVSKESVDGGKCVKQLTFGRLPRCLCLHIHRTAYDRGAVTKRADAVILPQFLNMDLFSYTGQAFKDRLLSGENLMAADGKNMEGEDNSFSSLPRRGPRATYYRLCSVIVHLGGDSNGGHYVTYRRVRQKERRASDEDAPSFASSVAEGVERWYMVSDQRVEEVDVGTVLRSQAYAVFYEKCERFSGLTSA